MEPLVASAAANVLRPSGALATDLAALLRDGRVLAGQVVQDPGDGTLLLILGRHRVPAQSDLRLDPGSTYLFQVVEGDDGPALRVLDGALPAEPQLLSHLRRVVGHDKPVGELLRDLAATLRAQLARPAGAAASAASAAPRDPALRAVLARLVVSAPAPGGGGEALRDALARSGTRYEAAVFEALSRGAEAVRPEGVEALKGDLKGQLLRWVGEWPEGPVREALLRTLAGLEAEQLLNVARERAGEPTVWSLPFPDGQAWTTVSLSVLPRDEHSSESQEGSAEGALRLVIGVDFQHTGPLRIDLVLGPDALLVRVLATRPEVAERLSVDAEMLSEVLSKEGRRVRLTTRVGTPAEVSVARRPLDIRYLREHHLMDVEG